MPWKDTINRAMYRVTGHMLTRETPDQRREAIRSAARESAALARNRAIDKRRRLEAQRKERAAKRRAEEAAAQRKERQRANAEARASLDDDVRKTIERVRPRTMTGPPKLAALVEATRYVVRCQIPGAVVECGVWRGGSMQAIAWTLLELGDTDRELHLFDTFEGMPPPTENDTRTTESGSVSAEELLAVSDKNSKLWAIAGVDDVREAMAETGYPADRVHLHPGLVEETTPGLAPDTIALLRLDTDWYASTKHELEHLYARLSPGGVLILDDYGSWDGARKATDEWLKETGEPLFLAPMGAGRIAIKPG
ncbi:MAG TPA: TylF/MycF/NovP-related O-methyltransferase [Nocardioides sp.]|jgi:hypothetical protein|nr:TylF/MycF/NovP-related O-methyltransferase [Nocardioides sp.]